MVQTTEATGAEAPLPTRSPSSRSDLLGWVVTGGGVLVLLVGSLPILVVAIPLGLVVVLLSVIIMSRGTASGGPAAGHGLAGLVTALVGLAVALALTLAPADIVSNLGLKFGSSDLWGIPAPTTGNPVPPDKTTTPPQPAQSQVLLRPVTVYASTAAEPSQDSPGVTFDAANVIDGHLSTAWGVEGRGIGQTLTFVFDRPVHLTAVGMVPGYAKIDGTIGVNQFVQNRRVTQARYSFTDGSSLDISFSDNPVMQGVRVSIDTTTVKITVLSLSPKVEKDFTAISEVAFEGWVAG